MLKNLFSPITIKGKTMKNRLAVAPMVTNYCNEDGTCTEMFSAYHETKAKGGFGMIITEDFAVRPRGKGFKHLPGLWNDEQIPGFKEFTKRIHKHDTVLIAQIYHAGRQSSKMVLGEAPQAPSAIPCPFSPDMPEELSIEEIKKIITEFGDCALRAEKAGFDGIEVHGAHGYLISQFMSSYTNKRTDEYGGSLQNRIRFAVEVVKDIRSKVSNEFIVGYRISADEYVTGGRNIGDTMTIVPYLEEAGIDYIHVSAGVYRSFDDIIPSQYRGHSWNTNAAVEVKKITKLPVISVGRINDPRLAETIIASGKSDIVAMGRQSLTDPETPNKAKEGRFDEIRSCIACHHGCVKNLLNNVPIQCILNPTLGRESEVSLEKTAAPKNIMVIGSGPAGLEAAITAASRGHRVKVFEKNRWAGGQFRIGAVPPGKGEMINYINWQLNELEKLNVPVLMETEVTPELVKKEKPDVVFAATGAEPIIPNIPGADRPNVVTAHDVLSGKVNTGNSVVVVGGGCVGAETANQLANYLKGVTIIEMLDAIAGDEIVVPRWDLLEDLDRNKVRICTKTTVDEITDAGVKVSGAVNEVIPCDTVVLAGGAKPVLGLADALRKEGYDVRVIGDAAKVGLGGEAIMEGFEVGRTI